jgi:ATP-binding cassette subfamily B protein
VSEKNILEQLNSFIKNKTSIVITHRLSTISKLDKIIVIKDGTIIEEGTHLVLLEHKGHYSEMWKKQSEGFLPVAL